MTYVVLTPEFQLRLTQANTDNFVEMNTIIATDPERNFSGNVCANGGQECAGDVRFYDWEEAGLGVVRPVLFTARNGSTISGRVWASSAGPAEAPADRDHQRLRPGSRAALLGPGRGARQARLRRAHLRPPGPGPHRHLRRGRRPQRRLPLPDRPPVLRQHRGRARLRALHARRALRPAAELHVGHRPLAEAGPARRRGPERRLQPAPRPRRSRAGSGSPATRWAPPPSPTSGRSTRASTGSWPGTTSRAPGGGFGDAPECTSGSAPRPAEPPITKPAMGISNDYGITPTPMTEDPDPQGENTRLPRLQGRRRRLAPVPHPRRHARGVGVHPRDDGPGARPGDAARLRSGRLVLDRLVRQAGQVRGRLVVRAGRRPAAAHRPLAGRPAQRPDRHQRRPQRLLVLPALPLRLPHGRRRRGRLRRHAHGLRLDGPRRPAAGLRPRGRRLHAARRIGGRRRRERAVRAAGDRERRERHAAHARARARPATRSAAARGNDRLRGLGGDDCLYGDRGNDRLRGDLDDDRLFGGRGRDRLRGGKGNDRLRSGTGSDRSLGGAGGDFIRSGSGRDAIGAGPGNDVVVARDRARDRVRCGSGRDVVYANRHDRLSGCEIVRYRSRT